MIHKITKFEGICFNNQRELPVKRKGKYMGRRCGSKKSFKYRLIIYFCIVSIIPIIIINIVAYYNIKAKVQENVDELKSFSLMQMDTNIKMALSSYEDLLYQMYTDDDIVALLDKINKGENIAVSRNQLRRTLRAFASAKDYIQCITVINKQGDIVFYDMLATSTTNTEWISRYNMTTKELYDQLSLTYDTRLLSTKYATTFNARPYYLFHMGHRIIDYKDIHKNNGVIILSIDERLLYDLYSQSMRDNMGDIPDNQNIIMDETGNVISFQNVDRIDTNIIDPKSLPFEREQACIRMVKDSGFLSGEYLKVYSIYDEELNWYFVNVSDQSNVIDLMKSQQGLTTFVIISSVLLLSLIIIFITNRLTGSIDKIVRAMKTVQQGELNVRVEADEHMPVEIEIIASQFNTMLEELSLSIEKEKEAGIRQKNAEISALEAQINPHFLYNTLDTINWMAIDKDEYEISNAINSLAKILRYGVDKSNKIVELKSEVEWLKQYVFLLQTRLKNTFECKINVEPEVLHYPIHKLLLQPFVENAIIHGFDGVKRRHELEILIAAGDNIIKIMISDNGKGMSKEMLMEIREGISEQKELKSHIGISNAIGRLRMYYGEQANVRIESELDQGTGIFIEIPII